MATGAELGYNSLATATQMANAIFGDGATVVGASYTGDPLSKAIYSNGNALSPGVVPSDTGVILSTGRAASFTQSSGDPNRSASISTNTLGPNNNPLFNTLAGTNTFDAAYLDVDFVPTGDVMTIRFVFSSDEYPEFAASEFNDVVGVWINGSNVPVSVGTGQTGVTNLGPVKTPNLFKSNTADQFNTEMDGFTITLSLTIPVNSGVVNSIRIGIADVADSNYDSNLLIAADSVQTTVVAEDDSASIVANNDRTINPLANDVNQTTGTLTITHVNGVAVSAGSSVTLATGQIVTLNADGTFTIENDADDTETSFTYTVKSSTGQVDVGIVTIDTIPCFVAGTLIRTAAGDVPVENLRAGDLVLTGDDGPQPLRWIGRRTVVASGTFAPVRIAAGTFGDHGTILVSPQHRVLIRDSLAELLFGEGEVLVAAKDLVNGSSVTVSEGGTVDYVHLLFDRHQVIWSAGLQTESFLPGPQTAQGFDAAVMAEICSLFPELDPVTGQGYSPAARRNLRGFEASVLLSEVAA